MKAYLVDDEQPCLDDLAWLLSQYPDIEVAGAYKNSVKALETIETCRPDVVFLDIDMPRMSGLELAHRIQARHTGVIIVFVTAYAGYALDAYKAYPLDFLVKPVLEEQLEQTVCHLRQQHALLHPEEEKHIGLNIKCFGSFEVNAPCEARFPTRRVKEMLLYLIDRQGVDATKEELLDALFEGKDDRSAINNLNVTLSRLKTLLDCWDGSRELIRLTEENALIIAPGVCDYTDFMSFTRRNAALSEKNIGDAAAVLEICRGPYLEKDAFNWAVESAREVEDEYERIALGLACNYGLKERFAEVENVLCALLERNPLSDDGYSALLDLYIQTSNREAYLLKYEEYARLLKKELRIKPHEVYRKHYDALKGKDKGWFTGAF